MGVLMHEEDLDIWEAYQAVLDHHPDALPAPDLVVSLADYYGTTLDKMDAANKTMELSLARQRKR